MNLPKRHSDPAPSTSTKKEDSLPTTEATYTHSAPNLKFSTTSPSPRSPLPKKAVATASPAKQTPSRKSTAVKYRRLSTSSFDTPSGYFNATPRRATHPSTSPRRFRRHSLFVGNEPDPWTEFRCKYLRNALSNNDNKDMMSKVEQPPSGCYRLRSFSVTSKGIVNLGDFLKARSLSETYMAPEEEETLEEPLEGDGDTRTQEARTEKPSNDASSQTKYRVLLLGAEGVGKTSIVAQFTTSECLTSITDPQASIDGSVERIVSLLVDGEESELICEDPMDVAYKVDDSIYCATDSFLVLYSVTDTKSFHSAKEILDGLRELKSKYSFLYPKITQKAVILVANKVDLVRCRIVTQEDGRSLADHNDIKYIETSVGFNHNVDELLVGIVTQIRLKKGQQREQQSQSKGILTRSLKFPSKARGLMDRFLQKCDLKTKSCDNLHVL